MDERVRSYTFEPAPPARVLRAVLFDFQGVISRRGNKGKGSSLAAMLERDFDLEAGSISALVGEHALKSLARKERQALPSEAEALEEMLAQRLGRRLDLSDWLLQRSRARLIQENLDLVRALRPFYRTGVLANSSGRLLQRMRRLGIDSLFDDVVDSGVVGIAKPDKRIYHLAAARLGCDPSQCLLIDDKPENVAGALQAGMQALYYSYEDGDDLHALLAGRGLPVETRRVSALDAAT